jgi:S-adenosylmethionine:tRNA ribosyltransferase-isomerase
VVNDSATLPASLPAAGIEVRLRAELWDGSFSAILFGEGDWRAPTERRPPPRILAPGEVIRWPTDLSATVERVSALSPRLVDLRFDRSGDALWSAIYAAGRPIQYSYVAALLDLWQVQTAYGARPWSVEMPSAGRPLRWPLLLELRRRGVGIAAITHAAGPSSTGDPAIDAALPLPERFDVPARTVEAVAQARASGGRVVAAGTSVVRALEGCAALHGGELCAGTGVTDLRIREGFSPRVVDGLLTGMHEPTASHFDLLSAFAPRALVRRAYEHAADHGYLWHELGDSSLILRGEAATTAGRSCPSAPLGRARSATAR